MSGVYIIQNSLFSEYIKIGRIDGSSLSDLQVRIKQFQTAVPEDFVVLAFYTFPTPQDAKDAEQGVHKALNKYRVRRNNEYFHTIIFKNAINILSRIPDAKLNKKIGINQPITNRKSLNLSVGDGFPQQWVWQERELFFDENPLMRAIVCGKNKVQEISKDGQRSIPISLSALTKRYKGGKGNYNGFRYWCDAKTGLKLRA